MPVLPEDPRASGSADVGLPIENAVLSKGSDIRPAEESPIRNELERILKSRYFRTAGRSRQFLQFAVEHRLAGHPEQLKERTIGIEVFQRPPDYATGDDPVVRVQAGEVRRRLDQFYQHDGSDSPVRIELPVGSYCPEFHWKADQANHVVTPTAQAIDSEAGAVASVPTLNTSWVVRNRTAVAIGAACLVLALLLAIPFALHRTPQRTSIDEFWGPVFGTPQPALICLAKGVTYRPSSSLYDQYRSTHPGTFQTEVERSSDPLPLDPSQTMQWRQMNLFADYGVAKGDVYAAVRISGILGQLGKTTQLRIGSDYTYQDLRNSPSVIIGAFNNKWTMGQMSNLHFSFIEDPDGFVIHEQVPNGRTWPLREERSGVWPRPQGSGGQPPQALDYAIVGRLMNSTTGQFTIVAAGLTGAGTEAAGEFVSSPALLEQAFRDAPPNWKKGNSLFVLRTSVTDAVAGPPTVVASYYW